MNLFKQGCGGRGTRTPTGGSPAVFKTAAIPLCDSSDIALDRLLRKAKLGHFSHFCNTYLPHFSDSIMLLRSLCIFMLVFLIGTNCVLAQKKQSSKVPKAIFVLSFDQMRGDFTERFSHNWGSKGFNRIMKEGSSSPLCYFNHISNMTCPGHAIILTGTYPSLNGIVSNDFFDTKLWCTCYCTEDKKHPVNGNSNIGRSPDLLKQSTLGDLLQKQQPKSKGLSFAIKDRAAILMAGKSKANAVLWFDWKSRVFATSSYYTQPTWIDDLNKSVPYSAYAGKKWNAILADSETAVDSMDVEGNFPGGDFMFPHDLGFPGQEQYTEALMTSPYSISYLFDAVKFAINRESIGKDEFPDIISIGISTTDLAGHLFGPDSREIQELYVHADSILGTFIDHLDAKIGRNNYVMVITSDHGVAPIPEYITKFGKLPVDAGRIQEKTLMETLEKELGKRCGQKENMTWIKYIEPPSIFLNDTTVLSSGFEMSMIADTLCAVLSTIDGIAQAAPTASIQQGRILPGWSKELLEMYRNDIHPDRTGEVMFMVKPYWLIGSKPASHGTGYDYDTHVPLMFLGGGIPAGQIQGKTDPADIMPTLASILNIKVQHRHGKRLELIKAPLKNKKK